MKVVIKDVNISAEKPMCLVPLSDIHVGHADHDPDFAKKTIDWIVKKDAYTVLLGDLIDGICPKDLRFENNSIADNFKVHLDNLHHKQTEGVLSLLKHLNPEKILAIMAGNHEETVKKYYSYDSTQVIAEKLKLDILPDPSYLVLRFDCNGSKRLVSMFCTHGQFMGGRKRGGKVNRMEDLSANFDADIFLAGHTHDLFVTRVDRVGLSTKGNFENKRKYFINTGSMMRTYSDDTDSTWASRKLFPPNMPGVARIDFYAKSKKKRRYIDVHVRT